MTSKGKNLLIGSLITFGALVALVIAAAIGFGVWLDRPGELLDPTRLLSSNATGYAEWTLRLDDPGTEGFVGLLIEAIQEMPPEVEDSLPPFVQSWVTSVRNDQARRDIEKLFPMVVAWTLHPQQAARDDLHLVSVNVQNMGNRLAFADWLAGFVLDWSDRSTVHKYQGEKIYQFKVDQGDFEPAFFGWRGAVVATSELAMARQAVDQLHQDENTEHDQTELEQLFARTRATDPFRAALTSRHGEVYRLWETIGGGTVENPEHWQELQGVALTGGLRADGSFALLIELVAPDAEFPEAYTEAMARAFRRGLERVPVEFAVQAAVLDDRLLLDVQVRDLVKSLTRLLE